MTIPQPVATELYGLFERSGDSVFAFLLARSGSRSIAEDLTAETFLAASERVAANEGTALTEGWLITVAHRRLIDHWRREAANSRAVDKLVVELRRVTGMQQQPAGEVEAALADLPPRYRAALILRYFDGFSVAEVADALGRSYKSTESILARARSAFSRAYEAHKC